MTREFLLHFFKILDSNFSCILTLHRLLSSYSSSFYNTMHQNFSETLRVINPITRYRVSLCNQSKIINCHYFAQNILKKRKWWWLVCLCLVNSRWAERYILKRAYDYSSTIFQCNMWNDRREICWSCSWEGDIFFGC